MSSTLTIEARMPAALPRNLRRSVRRLFFRRNHALQQLLEPVIVAQRIKFRFEAQLYHPLGALRVGFFEESECPRLISDAHIDQSAVSGYDVAGAREFFQLDCNLQGIAPPPGPAVSVAEHAQIAQSVGRESAAALQLTDRVVISAHREVRLPENRMDNPVVWLLVLEL